MKILRVALVAAGIGLAPLAQAAIIDNGTYTTDTGLGLDYLDVGLVRSSQASFAGGIVFAGRTWVLATAAQIASTWSSATGLPLSATDVLSADNDMGAAATATLISLFDGVTSDVGLSGEQVIGDFTAGGGSIDGYYNYIDGGRLAVHNVFDDSHFLGDIVGDSGAWLVSASNGSNGVSEPGALALFGAALLGCVLRRRGAK